MRPTWIGRTARWSEARGGNDRVEAAMDYRYERSSSGQYVLERDGKEVMRGTEHEVWRHLHVSHGYSVSHALEHEGYAIRPDSSVGR